MTTVQLERRLPAADRAALERRAKLLAWGGNAWHVIEFAIARRRRDRRGSVALVGFGIDSLIELLAGGVIVWLFSGGRGASQPAERRAQQLIAASYASSSPTSPSKQAATCSDRTTPASAGSGSGSQPSPRRRCRCSPARSAGSGGS